MSTQCRLLIITDTYAGQPGGSERHLYNFIKSVSPSFSIDLYQLIPSGNPMLDDGSFLENENVQLHSRPLGSILSFTMLRLVLELWRVVRSNQIDIIVSYHEKSDILNFLLSSLPGVKVSSVSSKRDMGFKLQGALKLIMKFITPKLKVITCPSQSIADQMVSDFSTLPEFTHVIKNGVDLGEYAIASDKEKLDLKEKLNIDKDYRVMICTGWLKPVKGHKYLIDAFSDFRKNVTEKWKLILLGAGELEEDLIEQAVSHDVREDIIFAGIQSNVQDWLKISDMAVTATLSEGLSNALIEAAATGLPIVGTLVGGNPEVVEDGKTGLLVPSKNSTLLSEAMQKLASNENLRLSMVKAARAKSEADFSVNSMTNKLENLYLSLISERSERGQYVDS